MALDKEQRMVKDPSYTGPERRHTHDMYCNKTCDNHDYVKETVNDIKEFKDGAIEKISKCMTAMAILLTVFVMSMTISGSSFVKSITTAEAHTALVKVTDEYMKKSAEEHEIFRKAITDLAIVATEMKQVKDDIQEIKEILKEEN